MTINKSQGQSYKVVGIHLPQPCFVHGQLYVALSRCGYPPEGINGVRVVIKDVGTKQGRIFSKLGLGLG